MIPVSSGITATGWNAHHFLPYASDMPLYCTDAVAAGAAEAVLRAFHRQPFSFTFGPNSTRRRMA